MLIRIVKYKSLHAYLDAVLHHVPHPTHLDIKNAKREYWKLWFRHYRRQKRKVRKEFTLGFDKQTINDIHRKKGKLSVSEYLYSCVLEATYDSTPRLEDREMFSKLHQNLMQLINLLEEAVDKELLPLEATENLLKIEEQFEKLLTKKC